MKNKLSTKMKNWITSFMLVAYAFNAKAYDCKASYTYTDNGTGGYTFSANTNNHYPNTTYLWRVNDIGTTYSIQGQTSNFQFHINGQHEVRLIVSYIYKDSLQPSNSFTCVDSVSQIINITGVQPIYCNAAFIIKQDSLGPHINSWTTINYSYGAGPLTYLWDFGDGSTSALENPGHIYTTPGNYKVCLTIMDPAGCTSTKCDTNTVQVLSCKAEFTYTNNIGNYFFSANTAITYFKTEYTWVFEE